NARPEDAGDICSLRDVNGAAMSLRAHLLDQARRSDPFDGVFAGAVDIADGDDLGFVEGARKLVHQVARARESMGLERQYHAPFGKAAPRTGQRSANLCRMMAVVVDDHDAAGLAAHGEAPRHAGKSGQSLSIDIEIDSQKIRYRENSERIQNI